MHLTGLHKHESRKAVQRWLQRCFAASQPENRQQAGTRPVAASQLFNCSNVQHFVSSPIQAVSIDATRRPARQRRYPTRRAPDARMSKCRSLRAF